MIDFFILYIILLSDKMKFIENEYYELKSILTKDIKKEIIAFANTNGGKIYIGVNDNDKLCYYTKK